MDVNRTMTTGEYKSMAVELFALLENPRDAGMLLASLLAILVGWYAYNHHRTKAMLKKANIPYIENSQEGNPLPWVGHVPTFLKWRPWDVSMAWHQRQGPILAYTLFGNTMYSIASPSLLRQTLQSKIANVKKDTANVMKPFLGILGTGIVTSEGKQRTSLSEVSTSER